MYIIEKTCAVLCYPMHSEEYPSHSNFPSIKSSADSQTPTSTVDFAEDP